MMDGALEMIRGTSYIISPLKSTHMTNRILYHAWQTMAAGAAIDVQRSNRWPASDVNNNNPGMSQSATSEQEASSSRLQADLGDKNISDDDDEDPNNNRDPNDAPTFPPNHNQTLSSLTPYDLLELDDYDDDDD